MNLWNYIRGNRKGKEAHRIEREAMNDPFLADALEGYENTPGNHQREVARLQKEMKRRGYNATGKSTGRKSGHLKAWGIVASILIVAAVSAWFLWDDNPLFPEIRPDNTKTIPESATIAQTETTTRIKRKKPIVEPVPIAEEEPAYLIEETAIEQEQVQPEEAQAEMQPEAQAQPKVESHDPRPVIGMKAYMEYIKRNLKRPTDDECKNATGPVVVVFKIGTSGRPYNIRAIKGPCISANQEAIRLIIHGPNWKMGSASDEATISIHF